MTPHTDVHKTTLDPEESHDRIRGQIPDKSHFTQIFHSIGHNTMSLFDIVVTLLNAASVGLLVSAVMCRLSRTYKFYFKSSMLYLIYFLTSLGRLPTYSGSRKL